MIDTRDFFEALRAREIDFFCGVPDSLLKDFGAYVSDHAATERHVITANEGAAVALACGYHLATGRIGLVYLQNSGQGNTVNPLLSLADPAVYGIPLLLLIGWRGEPGRRDEPQHVKQGAVTLRLLEAMEIPHTVLPESTPEAIGAIDEAITTMRLRKTPYALVARSASFSSYRLREQGMADLPLTRESAIEMLLEQLGPDDAVVSTTGMTSRELFELREKRGGGHEQDFLTVGSMGHASQIALGIALAQPERNVICLDGDGALLMHLGSVPVIGARDVPNFRHVVINNGAHDSVGGQPTVAMNMDLPALARAAGYRVALCAQERGEVSQALRKLLHAPGPGLLEIRVRKGARPDLGRPSLPPAANKEAFTRFLSR